MCQTTPPIRLYGAAVPPGWDGRGAARALLAAALRDAWGWTRTPPMALGPQGKPWFPGCPQHCFNLSHTEGLCLCALSLGGEVGVDVERVRPRSPGLIQYALSGAELAGFDGTWEDFCRLWTRKEAFCKFQGSSIFPPRAVPAQPPAPCRSYAGDGWRAALCAAAEPLPEEICWAQLSL